MEPADLVVEARWIIPIVPAVALERHAVAVRAGRIVEIAPAAIIAARYRAQERVVLDRHAVLPGFVNAHTEAAATLLRGVRVRGPVLQWLHETVWPLERRWLSAGFVRTGTQLAVVEMIRAGVTCFADMHGLPEEVAHVAKLAHLRAAIGLPIADATSPWGDTAADHLERATALWDAYRADPLVSLFFAPQAWHGLTRETVAHLRRVVDQLEAPLAMRLHETQSEVRQSIAVNGVRPLAWLAEQGLLRPGFSGVHMNWLDAGDIDLVAKNGIGVVHCPQMNLRLGSGIAPLRSLRDAGVLVALGSGSPLAGGLDPLAEARAAALLAAGAPRDRDLEREPADGLDARDALRMATLDGARVLGLDADIGSLEVGKAADLISIELRGAACQPEHDPVDALLYNTSRADVVDSWIAGRAVMRDRHVLAFDEASVIEAANEWTSRFAVGAAA